MEAFTHPLDHLMELAPDGEGKPWHDTIATVVEWVKGLPQGLDATAKNTDSLNRARRTLAACQTALAIYVGECKRLRNEAEYQINPTRDGIAEAIYQAGQKASNEPTDDDERQQDIDGAKPSPVVVIKKISYERAKGIANNDPKVQQLRRLYAYWDAEWTKANKLMDAVSNTQNALSGDVSALMKERQYINFTEAASQARTMDPEEIKKWK